MGLEKYLNSNEEINLLRRFAFVGTREQFNKKLNYLERIAEKEKWKFKGTKDSEDLYVLFYYIVHTFDRCFKQEKIVIAPDESYALFNTGLMTPSGDEIYCLFTPSNSYDKADETKCFWYLNKFVKENDRDFLNLGLNKPEMATYYDDYNELYFDPTADIIVNFDHIFDDNYDRLPESFRILDKSTASQVFDGFISHTKKRILRNSRIPVPQFYRDKIMFLIPVKAFDEEPIVLALEKMTNGYRANTILTMNMAYNCARLLTKPESNWLLVN